MHHEQRSNFTTTEGIFAAQESTAGVKGADRPAEKAGRAPEKRRGNRKRKTGAGKNAVDKKAGRGLPV